MNYIFAFYCSFTYFYLVYNLLSYMILMTIFDLLVIICR